MGYIVASISRFSLGLMMVLYTIEAFRSLLMDTRSQEVRRLFNRQTVLIYLTLINGVIVLYVQQFDYKILLASLAEFGIITAAMILYKYIYAGASYSLVNHMCMFLTIGFLMLVRLKFSLAKKQLMFCAIALIFSAMIPVLFERFRFFKTIKWFYAIIGLGMLSVVTLLGNRTFGANLSISVAGITIQPSELVKIFFVFFVASMLQVLPLEDRDPFRIHIHRPDFKIVFITSCVAAGHILVLVGAKDLGSASIFFLCYLAMLYVATRKPGYFILGLGAFALAAIVGYRLFPHVQQRVEAWQNPVKSFDGSGFQMSQSLFAIASGGWFGSGLGQGMPDKIPVVTKDFIFAAICEEFGGIYALCLLLLCIAYFLAFMRISLRMRDPFYKIVACGLGVTYAIQVVLMIGGVIKFIPSTGVTLPLVSYGGSSLLSTILMIAVIQGLYCRQSDREHL